MVDLVDVGEVDCVIFLFRTGLLDLPFQRCDTLGVICQDVGHEGMEVVSVETCSLRVVRLGVVIVIFFFRLFSQSRRFVLGARGDVMVLRVVLDCAGRGTQWYKGRRYGIASACATACST